MTRLLFALGAAALLGSPAFAGEASGGCHGTAIDFADTPKEAAAIAKKQEKLVLVLHISGHFENPGMT